MDDAVAVRLGVISVLSPSHPDVAGENIFRRAVREARKQQLLLPVIGKRQKKELVARVCGQVGGWWQQRDSATRISVRVGNVEEIFSALPFNEFRESRSIAIANERLKF